MVHRTTKVCSAWRVISPLSTKGPRKLKRSPEPRAPLRAGGSRGSRMLPSRIPVAWKNAVCRRRWIKMGFRGHPFWSGLGKPLGQPPCFGVLKTKLMRIKMAPEKWIGCNVSVGNQHLPLQHACHHQAWDATSDRLANNSPLTDLRTRTHYASLCT